MTKLHFLNGPDRGSTFDLGEDPVTLGRAPGTGILVRDKAVSRRHLEIRKKGGRLFLKDLKSKNGTFLEGEHLESGVEVEVKEGVPIVIGMSVICLGKGCLEHVMPFLESIELTGDFSEDTTGTSKQRARTNQKNMELIYKVSSDLNRTRDIDEILKKMLEHIFNLLKRIERGVIILVDPETGEMTKETHKVKNPGSGTTAGYCKSVVDQVIQSEKPVIISDAHTDCDSNLSDTLQLSKVASVMCIPLISGSSVRGVIYLDSQKRPYGFRKEDLAIFEDLSRRAALAIENASLHAKLGD